MKMPGILCRETWQCNVKQHSILWGGGGGGGGGGVGGTAMVLRIDCLRREGALAGNRWMKSQSPHCSP